MHIAADTVVSLHYRLTDDGGEVLDTSEGREPLSYLHGHGRIISGLEEALLGRAAGESLTVEVPPERAYGEFDPDLETTYPITAFTEESRQHLAAGIRFRASHPRKSEQPVVFTIKEVRAEGVDVSGNHPLAGKTLHFAIDILEVRAATEEDLQERCSGCGGGCEGGQCSH